MLKHWMRRHTQRSPYVVVPLVLLLIALLFVTLYAPVLLLNEGFGRAAVTPYYILLDFLWLAFGVWVLRYRFLYRGSVGVYMFVTATSVLAALSGRSGTGLERAVRGVFGAAILCAYVAGLALEWRREDRAFRG